MKKIWHKYSVILKSLIINYLIVYSLRDVEPHASINGNNCFQKFNELKQQSNSKAMVLRIDLLHALLIGQFDYCANILSFHSSLTMLIKLALINTVYTINIRYLPMKFMSTFQCFLVIFQNVTANTAHFTGHFILQNNTKFFSHFKYAYNVN